MRHGKRDSKKRAFTIVELLTVMGVIALLIGLLAPALNAVRRHARDTKQRAQFNSIKAGLEMFRTDQGDYPISNTLSGGVPNYTGGGTNVTTGAQHLAEALLGRDLRGFDTLSTWDAQADDTGVNSMKIYASTTKGSVPADIKDCDARRKGPYLDIENVGAFNINQLYPVTGISQGGIYGYTDPADAISAATKQAPFITDVYTDRNVTITYTTAGVTASKTMRAGTPVLYFKANPINKTLKRDVPGAADFTDRTYNYWDNANVLKLGKMSVEKASLPAEGIDPGFHPMASTAVSNYDKFYEAITNYQIPDRDGVPYRQDSYVLMSAGRDGLFGTTDDIYNYGD